MSLRLARFVLLLSLAAGACTASPTVRPAPSLPASPVPGTLPASPTAAAPGANGTPAVPAATTPPPGPEYFTESFDAMPPYWANTQVDSGSPASPPSVQGGSLNFDLPAPNQWSYALYSGHDYGDVQVEAQLQAPIQGDGAAGVVCRYDARQGWYELNVFGDGSYQLLFGQWLATGLARYTPLLRGATAVAPDRAGTIGLLCQGNVLQPLVNGAPLRRWQENRYVVKQGEIGLSASSFADVPYSAAFDWVRVSKP